MIHWKSSPAHQLLDAISQSNRTEGRAPYLRTALWFVLLATTIWLLRPAFAPVHVEGFSASIVSIGLHYSQGTVRDFRPLTPLSADYFGLTKFGAVIAVAKLSPLLGGDGAMRLLMHLGLALSLAASVYLVRIWSGARWLIVVGTLIVVPGTIETGFYFNDNLPAAALLFAGLAILLKRRSLKASSLAGILIGWAIAFRIDTMLVAGVAVPLATWQIRDWRRSILAMAITGLAALVTLFAIFAMAGVTPFDALRAGMVQVELWHRPPDPARQLMEFLYFLGLPGTILALLGIMQLVRERRWHLFALLAGVPLAINLLQFGTLWQARQFVTLAPFICGLAARGGDAVLDDFKAGRRIFPLMIAGFGLFVLVGPVRGLKISDGPHEYVGRLSGIALWTGWQDQIRYDFRRIDRLIDMSADHDRTPSIFITDYWNEDRYLHLRLVERGFRRVPLPAPCGKESEGYRRDDRFVIEFTATYPSLRGKQMDQVTVPCAHNFPSARLVLLADSAQTKALIGLVAPNRALQPDLAEAGMGWLSAVKLNGRMLAQLSQAYHRQAAGMPGPQSLQDIYVTGRSRTAFSR